MKYTPVCNDESALYRNAIRDICARYDTNVKFPKLFNNVICELNRKNYLKTHAIYWSRVHKYIHGLTPFDEIMDGILYSIRDMRRYEGVHRAFLFIFDENVGRVFLQEARYDREQIYSNPLKDRIHLSIRDMTSHYFFNDTFVHKIYADCFHRYGYYYTISTIYTCEDEIKARTHVENYLKPYMMSDDEDDNE
jgi:hypothetical protein